MTLSALLLVVAFSAFINAEEVRYSVCGVFGNTIGGDPTTVKECNAACGSTAATNCSGTTFEGFPTPIEWTPTTQARWGVPPPNAGQAGFGYGGLTNTTSNVLNSEYPLFPCGKIAHFNNPVAQNTIATAAVLTLNFDFGNGTLYQANLELDIDETPNSRPCKAPSAQPCADILSFKNDGLFLDTTVQLDWFGQGLKAYALQVVGVADADKPISEYALQWISQEKTSQNGNLVCRLIPPCPATCEDATVTPGPVFLADGSKVCGCKNETVVTKTGFDLGTLTPSPTVAESQCQMLNEPSVPECQSNGCCFCSCEYNDRGVLRQDTFCSSAQTADACLGMSSAPGVVNSCTLDCGTPAPTPMPPTVAATTTMVGGAAATTGGGGAGGAATTASSGSTETYSYALLLAIACVLYIQ